MRDAPRARVPGPHWGRFHTPLGGPDAMTGGAGRPSPTRAPLRCPCDLAGDYARCCGRWHGQPGRSMDAPPAPDAATLMRSRYAAYALGRDDYVLATWHRSTRPDCIDAPAGLRWLGLTVRSTAHDPALDADHATVAFVARSRIGGGPAHRLVETSRFVREDGRWWYVDGDVTS